MRRRLAILAAQAVLLGAVVGDAWARSPGQPALDAGAALYQKGRYREALEQFEQAVHADPALVKAWENLGWAQHRLGNDTEAIRLWTTLLKLEPDNVSMLNALSEAQASRRAWAEAASVLRKSLELRHDQPDIRLRYGQALEGLDRPDDAEAQYRAILQGNPSHLKARIRLAELEERRGEPDRAVETLRQAAARDPSLAAPLGPRIARLESERGNREFQRGAWDEAVAAYESALRWKPGDPRQLTNLGWAERRAGRTDRAIEAWTRAAAANPPDPAALSRNLGDACLEAGRADDARSWFEKAATADPADAEAYLRLARLAFDAGDTALATRQLDAMLDRSQPDSIAFREAADLFASHGGYDEGARWLGSARTDPSKREAAGSALARLLSVRAKEAYGGDRLAEAAALYRSALEADPLHRPAFRDLGWTLWREGLWTECEEVWSRYAAVFPGEAQPHELLAKLRLARKEFGGAVEEAGRNLALSADPDAANLLLARTLLEDGRLSRARPLASDLASRLPGDLAVQRFYAEVLWRARDFAAAKDQWRKVLDMGYVSPRAIHYWLRSTYESGEYEAALEAARREAASESPQEPVLRLLAEDATVREDHAEAARWLGELARRFPGKTSYPLSLADELRNLGRLTGAVDVLEDALFRRPGDLELRLGLAEAHRDLRENREALTIYDDLRRQYPQNRYVFQGRLDTLIALRRFDDALDLIEHNRSTFLKDYEITLRKATILASLHDHEESDALLASVAVPPRDTAYVPILLYHGLGEHPRSLNLPAARFEEQIAALAKAGFTSVSLPDLEDMIAGRKSFPARPIVITFDDARLDSFKLGDPVLERHGMKATMFVPTSRIHDDNPFHADWHRISTLAATGRWDIESHGHLAHDPIVVDAAGDLGEFLVNRQWLEDEGRLETREEFEERLDSDYTASRRKIEENLPGRRVAGYAFPFSEIGQGYGGNEPDAPAINERLFQRHYRFGLVQDSSGYNVLRGGTDSPQMLRRFSVPRGWDGARLVEHLALGYPPFQARFEAAKNDLWSGRIDTAGKELDELERREPWVGAETVPYLAEALREQGRVLEAGSKLRALPPRADEPPDSFRRRLGEGLDWDLGARLGTGFLAASDSDRRDTRRSTLLGHMLLPLGVGIRAEAGIVTYRDRAFPALHGRELTLGGEWQAPARWNLDAWVRGSAFGDAPSSVNAQITAQRGVDRHRVRAGCSIEDVETVGARREGMQGRGCDGVYLFQGSPWKARVALAEVRYDDGNRRMDARAGWSRGMGPSERIEIGATMELGDSRFLSPFYYMPERLVSGLAVVRYRSELMSRYSLDAEAGAGFADDAPHGGRWVSRARLGASRAWTPRFRTVIDAQYSVNPGYHRRSLNLTLEFHL